MMWAGACEGALLTQGATKQGADVMTNMWWVHRDPQLWDAPDCFRSAILASFTRTLLRRGSMAWVRRDQSGFTQGARAYPESTRAIGRTAVLRTL